MDSSGFLILPFSAIIAFFTLIGMALAKRPAPRLIWPFAVSILVGTLTLYRLPRPSELVMWLFVLLALAFSAALGTVIGGLAARAIIAAFRPRRRG